MFDLNGTLATDGIIPPAVVEALKALNTILPVHILTAGTHGRLEEVARATGITPTLITDGRDKARHVRALDPAVAVGNGRNDVPMFRAARLAVAVIGTEGVNVSCLAAADIVVHSGLEAIDLLRFPQRLVATLRP
ncbi:conserved protein of unknown function [Candidatus Hydrogenisulfobacillus filiaventi]|uniref:HAD family hydrolase n=1 Tax=Candidatus Hydrogenisulfobacillus filiaventi TaxID=2707344 RepID=A0A6F8ZDH3_9FIRM|nr:conserved protein of unknown function [Candidatus Hydrogenisulfobacillus filiaventi]